MSKVKSVYVTSIKATKVAAYVAVLGTSVALAENAKSNPVGAETKPPPDYPENEKMAFGKPSLDSQPVEIGSRRELFVDNYIIGGLKGGATRHLFEMTPATTARTDVAITHDADWEGPWCRYAKYIQDEGMIKAWYLAMHPYGYTTKDGRKQRGRVCYATSQDGHCFTKPNLGIYTWEGSTDNNVLFGYGDFQRPDSRQRIRPIIVNNFSPFIDTNPAAPSEARYKAFSGAAGHSPGNGFFTFTSGDGIHWKVASDKPIISRRYVCDSPNQGFWDPERKHYALYLRHMRNSKGEEGLTPEGRRDIMVSYSEDFINWTEPQWLVYHRDDGRPGMMLEHLYTNEIKPYKRAPHIYLGFPARFLPPKGCVEPMLMASRDGVHFYRWMEHPLISTKAPADRDKMRSNHLWQEMIELPDEPNNYSMYASENFAIKGAHKDGSFNRVRRFTIRKDGFVSVRAEKKKGELVTKSLIFDGYKLTVNYNAKLGKDGSIRVEILDAPERPIPGFTANDCDPLTGDQIDATVTWKGKADVRSLAGKPVFLRFVLHNADLFSFRFAGKE